MDNFPELIRRNTTILFDPAHSISGGYGRVGSGKLENSVGGFMGKKIVNYKLCYNSSLHSLEIDIIDLIRKGWQPFGAPFLADVSEFYAQAMVQYEE